MLSSGLYISGEFDFAVCGGHSNNVLEHPARDTYFPSVTEFQAIVQPGFDLGIHFSYDAKEHVV